MRFFNSSLIDKLFVWVVGLFMAFLLLLELGVDGLFVNEEQYIAQSQEVRLDDYEIVDSMIAPHLFHARSNIHLIKAGNTYYAFYYYRQKKNDRTAYSLGLILHSSNQPTLFFPVHPNETVQGKGTADNPIHVFNFGLASKQYEWDDESYRYNIKKDFVCYQMFQCGRFAPWVYNTLFGLFALMPFIYLFRRMYLESLDRKRAAS
ncbi:hypothetical protein [Wielerella bovis]|uniref:hypothetical protein n=1 Tax=Wielerella bovis TaxID=2917790 RepID=UPI0020190DC4|nr:hypothetical protein [Wielerella bovis]ULJ61871.1 hypothetical protein MIS46_07665 [Wielerella bovis]ULJ63997.1 hypothetical protein MIS33_07455 [Wielerella bovis]ULJ68021.1 hypothetical protein MIS31_05680 [Wielerella bovis]